MSNYSRLTRQRFRLFFIICFGLGTFFCCLFIICMNNYNKVPLLPIVPISFLFGFLFIVHKKFNILKSVVADIFFAGFFLRMVLFPVLMILADYNVKIPNTKWDFYINEATCLISYEYLVLCGWLFISSKKQILNHNGHENIKHCKISNYVWLILLFLLGFAIMCIVLHPSFLLIFDTIFQIVSASTEEIILKNSLFNQMRENTSSILYTLFYTAITFIQILLPATLLNFIYNLNLKGLFLKKKINVAFCVLVIIFSLSIFTDALSKTLVIALAIFLTVSNIYSHIVKKWVPIFFACGGCLALFLLLAKAGIFNRNTKSIENIAKIFNTYFSGIPNISVGLSIEYPNKSDVLLGDFLRSIPLFAHFFVTLPRSQDLFNYYYHGVYGYTNEIMPTICYGYKYLGIFAPLFSILIYKYSFKLEKKFFETEKVFNKTIYAFFSIYFAICPIMYMFTSFLTMFWYSVVFIIIIYFNDVGTNRKRSCIYENI